MEGIAAIVLTSSAIDAWKTGESHWKPWSSKLVMAALKVECSRRDFLHVLSCYAST